jgi:hypothetical protein
MRSRILAVAGVSAAALAAATAFAGTAGASSNHVAPAIQHTVSSHATPAKGKACYSLTSDDSGTGIVSQNFTDAGFSQYDAAGAADFSGGKKCKAITSVDTTGVYFNGAGPADSVNVIFYKDASGAPGTVMKEYDGLSYTDSTGTGSLNITVPKTKAKHKGTYWVSVVANMAFSAGGEWGWELSTDTNGNADQWENPGGGLGTSCTTWGPNLTCLGFGGDYMVTLAK